MRKWLVVCAIRKSGVRPNSDSKCKVMPWAGGEGSKGMLYYREMRDVLVPVQNRNIYLGQPKRLLMETWVSTK